MSVLGITVSGASVLVFPAISCSSIARVYVFKCIFPNVKIYLTLGEIGAVCEIRYLIHVLVNLSFSSSTECHLSSTSMDRGKPSGGLEVRRLRQELRIRPQVCCVRRIKEHGKHNHTMDLLLMLSALKPQGRMLPLALRRALKAKTKVLQRVGSFPRKTALSRTRDRRR